jgi:hypothetical protein
MEISLVNNGALDYQSQAKKKVSLFKFLIAFFVLIINADTISYLLLQNDAGVALYQKMMLSAITVVSLIFFLKWKKTDRICFYVFMFFLVKLIIESLIKYRSLLAYPSVLAVISPFLYVYFIKNLFAKFNIDVFHTILVSIFVGYFIFMILNGNDFDFNNTPLVYDETGPYSGDTRILHANSILLLVLPFTYFLNKVVFGRKTSFAIGGFVISLIIILIHQHRTVWVTTIFSGLLLFFMKGKARNILRKLFLSVLCFFAVFILLILIIPGFDHLVVERFADILNPLREDSTSAFRYLQILSYLNYSIQKPLFGWTFSGFELSNPFTSYWEEGTGHHFHNAYIEVLFYFGITGCLMKFYPLYSVAKKVSRQLSDKTKILAAFSISGFVYSFSYVPPLIFWGIVGVCLYYIERDLKNIMTGK